MSYYSGGFNGREEEASTVTSGGPLVPLLSGSQSHGHMKAAADDLLSHRDEFHCNNKVSS